MRLDRKFAGLETKIDVLHFEVNERFDRVYDEPDEIVSRVTLLEACRA